MAIWIVWKAETYDVRTVDEGLRTQREEYHGITWVEKRSQWSAEESQEELQRANAYVDEENRTRFMKMRVEVGECHGVD